MGSDEAVQASLQSSKCKHASKRTRMRACCNCEPPPQLQAAVVAGRPLGALYSHRHGAWRCAAGGRYLARYRYTLGGSFCRGITEHKYRTPLGVSRLQEPTLVATPHPSQTRVGASQDGVVPRSNDCASGRQLTDRSSCSDKTAALPPKKKSLHRDFHISVILSPHPPTKPCPRLPSIPEHSAGGDSIPGPVARAEKRPKRRAPPGVLRTKYRTRARPNSRVRAEGRMVSGRSTLNTTENGKNYIPLSTWAQPLATVPLFPTFF